MPLSAASVLMLASLIRPALATDPAAFLPPGKICEKAADGASYVDRHKLMNWTVAQTWEDRVIPQDVWDLNRDGDVTYEEKLGVLFKLEVFDICTRGKCTEGDPEAINNMRYSFRKAFDPTQQKRYLVMTPKGQPDAEWEGDLRTVFDYKHTNLRVKCLKEYEADKIVYDVTLPTQDEDGPDNSGFRVALNRDDLSTARSELRELVPAKFSVTDDRQNDEWTWAVEGYAGYQYVWRSDELRSSGRLIPFAHVVQKSSEDEDDEDEIDKLGLGLDTAFYQSFLGNVQGGVEYLTDSDAKLDILGGQLIWLPPFGRIRGSYIGHFIEIGDTGIEVKIRPRLTLHGGRIFDRGSVETISSKSDYLRGGPGVRIQLRGVDGSSFEDFEFSADAKYLFGMAGDTDDYYRLVSSLNYFFPGQDHFSLGLSYTYGYQDETLEKEDLIEAVLGARF